MSIRHLHETERPREKMRRMGATALADAQLLALVLGSGRRGQSAVALGQELLDQFGGLRGVFAADLLQLIRHPGVGLAKACQLCAVAELIPRTLGEPWLQGVALTAPAHAARFLRAKLGLQAHEQFACLFLDQRHRVIKFEVIFQGTIDRAQVHPREVLRRCLRYNAAAVILAHNHPSGDSHASDADRHITAELKTLLETIDVRVLDHFIIGKEEILSFSEQGWL